MNPAPNPASEKVLPVLGSRRRRLGIWTTHALVGLYYTILIGVVFPAWLRPFEQPRRGGPDLPFRAGDLTPLFSVWTQVTARALFDRGEWPLWSDHIYCGEPFFAKPQIGVLSLTTALSTVFPPQVIATWTFLLHLWIAGMAMYVWCLDALLPRGRLEQVSLASTWPMEAMLSAATGGVIFMLSGLMVEHAMIGHGPIVLVACWTPLLLKALGRALCGFRTVRESTKAGIVLAVQLLSGGETVFLYNLLAGGLLGLAWLVCGWQVPAGEAKRSEARPFLQHRSIRRLLRLSLIAVFMGLTGFMLSAVKVLPGLELMPISNRAGGLSLEDASGFVEEFREPAAVRAIVQGVSNLGDWRTLFPITCLLGLTGMVMASRREAQRMFVLAALLMIVAGIAIAHSRGVFACLWQCLPVFRYQRIPQRAMLLSYLGIGMLGSLGTHSLLTIGGIHGEVRATSRPWGWRTAVAICLILGVTLESWLALPQPGPTADIRREVRDNSILNWIAHEPGEFRIHAVESTDRNWGIEHVTVPLGLKNLAGWDHLWLLEYLGAEGVVGRDVRPYLTASYQALHPTRFWGLMNVRFVTSMRPQRVPGLRFVREFPISPSSQPAKSAGPYLYENEEFQDRVRIVPQAILVIGERAEKLEATYRLIDHPSFDPSHVVLLDSTATRLGTGSTPEPEGDSHSDDRSPEKLAGDSVRLPFGCSAVVSPVPRDESSGRAGPPDESHVFYSVRVPPSSFWITADAVESMLHHVRRLSSAREPPPVIESVSGNSWRIRLSGQKGYLVIADKLAHFPGWMARSATGPREVLKANGVATAIVLDGSEQWIELRYWPPGLTNGIVLSALGLVLVAGVLGWGMHQGGREAAGGQGPNRGVGRWQ